ncbi:hypothetical protein B9Z55_021595 [Caenorhabditis nigoni]|uniref:F-box domain-containing protein n=1 Tax=Caenorhabditis nigoni TaxID=1611254 RepID=A0A2G5TST2_9PELO|nr:hypothetical protein B9Z55_021595 [Caenorhabditis nigoni]
MPIRILSLPAKDLQYALECMDFGDLIVFSLCSKRTKNLVKSLNLQIDPILADVCKNYICLQLRPSKIRGVPHDPDPLFLFLTFSNFWIKIDRKNGIAVWKEDGFNQSDWIAHFLDIFKGSFIEKLRINNVCPISYLDIVKQIIPNVRKLQILEDCSVELTKRAFLKLAPISMMVEIGNISSDHKENISEFLTWNVTFLTLKNSRNPFKLGLNDLLVTNTKMLTINNANITEKELNRFLKLWMKRNQSFYQPKMIRLTFRNELNIEEVLKGMKQQIVKQGWQLKRADGKELSISIRRNFLIFFF